MGRVASLQRLKSDDAVVSEKRSLLDRIVKEGVGLEIKTVIEPEEAVPGEQIKLRRTRQLSVATFRFMWWRSVIRLSAANWRSGKI